MSEIYDSLAYYRIKQLEETNERLKSQLMETNNTLEKANSDRNDLLRQLDTAEKEREAIREESLRNIREGYKMECDLKELRQKYDYLERSHKRLGDIRNRLAKENEDLKQQNYTLGQKCQAETNTREYWRLLSNGRGEKICKLMRENAELQRQIDILKQRDVVFVDLDSSKLKGMQELWGMLGEMFDVDYNNMLNIFGYGSINNIAHNIPDVKDFLKKYETWKGEEDKDEEQKRFDYMRDYLHRFCLGKVCYGCPLNTPEFKCYGHGGFKSISDEDLKRYYWKARGFGRFPWADKKEEKPSDEVPCSFNWKLDGTEYTIETSIPRKDYDNIVKIISGKE